MVRITQLQPNAFCSKRFLVVTPILGYVMCLTQYRFNYSEHVSKQGVDAKAFDGILIRAGIIV